MASQTRKWVKIKEQPGDGKEPPQAKNRKEYELRSTRVGKIAHMVRFNVATGESWHIEGDTYKAMAEMGPVPSGDYNLTLVATDANWMAFRMDRATGGTWLLKNQSWFKVSEPE